VQIYVVFFTLQIFPKKYPGVALLNCT